MTENLPESFDPQQPDLPTLGVDPDPIPESHGEDTSLDPVEGSADEGGTLPAT
ncbi:chromosome partitioning protein [Cellulomonas aerilata]|uniref:Uncharacterized protein n=1 Tax=Cellulomonas aerilata TaxID=515326 RepID=A0A512D9S2_9CELL|nr:chromosome partitioning protein [Cellulomonas aerilata]GEO33201.1 hypothetical protein CAE01nite_09260 [Cellulomonas aerilata]